VWKVDHRQDEGEQLPLPTDEEKERLVVEIRRAF
jgi:hypothetical protein